ncbi:MAG: hypothetical protein ACR2H1_07745 [Limisphaerales bacterium]
MASCFHAPRPEGYFADVYKNIGPEQIELEEAFAKMKVTQPDEAAPVGNLEMQATEKEIRLNGAAAAN